MFSLEAEMRQLKIDNEELTKLVNDYKGITNVILKKRQDMTLKEDEKCS